MRVIAGSARRLNLVTPKGLETRPTGDKIKETLFNILAPYVYDVDFLDLFAGSGGIGIEALSRGARSCTFVEKSKDALDCIRKNLTTTGFMQKATVVNSDVCAALYNLRPKNTYDIVFMDPPYGNDLEKPVLSILKKTDIIDKDTLIIVEAQSDTDFSFAASYGYSVERVKDYKNSKHVFLRLEDNSAEED